MANVKITDLAALTNPASTDVLPIVDVGADVTKKISIADLLENAGSGTASAPGIAFDGDSNTGIYRPGADQLAISTNGTGRLYITSDGKVGVGDNAPNVKFTVKGALSSGGKVASIQNEIASHYGGLEIIGGESDRECRLQSAYGSSYFTFYTQPSVGSATEKLRITSDGKVGLGTSSPSTLMEMQGSSSSGQLTLSNSVTGVTNGTEFGSILFKSYDSSINTNSYTGNVAEIKAVAQTTFGAAFGAKTALIFSNADPTRPSASGPIQLLERMRIDDEGRVGIGTTGPEANLHVFKGESSGAAANAESSLVLENDSNTYLQFLTPSTNESGILFGDDDNDRGGITYSHSTDALSFRVNASTRAAIDSSGRLLVGTVTSPAYQLQLETDSAGKPSTNTWTIVSDERIKEDIELADLDICYDAIKNIPLKRFKWKDEVYTEEQVPDRHKLGWIAQDVESVFPKAVRIHEFKYNQVFGETVIPAVEEELDEDGNVITPAQPERIEKGELISEDVIEDCRDLNADQLYAAMYGAIQKLIAKVEALESELLALKSA